MTFKTIYDIIISHYDEDYCSLQLVNSRKVLSKGGMNIHNIARHILTASREGDGDVRMIYLFSALFNGLLLGVCLLIWHFTRNWIFPEFNPFSYWNIIGNFWENIIPISIPVLILATLLGQLDWFSDDVGEDGTIVSENILFKSVISFFAGLFEELTYRGVLIWVGLIMVYLSNKYFSSLVALILLLIFIGLALGSDSKIFSIIILSVFTVFWLLVRTVENPVHMINKFILEIYQWTVAENIRMFVIYLLLMTLAMMMISSKLKETHPLGIILRVLIFVIWTIYALPKGISVLGNLPIIPTGASEITALLYIGAVMWSNLRFKEGHKYQGQAGMLNSYIFAFYMIYIVFTFGMIYAIAVHFLYDLFIFLSEHIVQIIKNRGEISSY